jgi:carboxymethylenebutenolidase
MPQTQPDGYLAMPAAGEGSPVLVLHAWWGLNDTVKSICKRLADEGFVAFAPDLYHGKVTDQIDEAEKLAQVLFGSIDQPRGEIAAAMAFLKEHAGSGTSGMAVVGFSLGAFFALDLSVNAPETIRSVVVFYGTGPSEFGASQAYYLAHFAETDPFEPPENLEGLGQALKDAGRPATFYTYPGTGHWFFEPDRADAYNAAAADLAWDRTLVFLKRVPAP